MWIPSWWKRRLRTNRVLEPDRSRKKRRRLRAYIPLLETLEDRIVPASWSGDISSDTTWSNTSVQSVIGNVHVDTGVTLTIQPGTVVQFSNATNLTVDGTLLAQGTSGQTIYFTSYRDNSPTGGADSASPGDWGQILFTSNSTNCTLQNATVEYGGSEVSGEVEADSTSPTISNTTIAHSQDYGVLLKGSDATLTGDTFLDNTNSDGAIGMDLASAPVISGTTFTNNLLNGVALTGSTLPAGTTTWNNPSVVYVPTQNLTVPQGGTLTIAAGQVVELGFPYAGSLTVQGTLEAQGSTSAPVVFTSINDKVFGDTNNNPNSKPSHGDWSQILFTSTSTNCTLQNVVVDYGGYIVDAEVEADSASPSITNSTISNSSNYGLRLKGSDATLTGDTFTNNNNSGGAIHMDLASQPVLTALSLVNNYVDGVNIDGGNLPAGTTTWDNPGVVYVPVGTITVPAGATLAIDAGQIVKLGYFGYTLTVSGTLTAEGTASQPVVFTSFHDDTQGGDTDNDAGSNSPRPADWSQLLFTSTSTADILNYVNVLYGGYTVDAVVEANGASPTISNCIISNNSGYGVTLTNGSTATLSGDAFDSNGFQSDGNGGAIHIDTTCEPNIQDIAFSQAQPNFLNAVVVDSGTLPAGTTTWTAGVVYWLKGIVTVPQAGTLLLDPGAIVKQGNESGALVVNGTLTAQGTVAQPIIFTSYNDATASGLTIDNGPPQSPQPGDWAGIQFTSTSTSNVMDHVAVRYGGTLGTQNLATIEVDGGSLTMTDSEMSYGIHAGLLALTGTNVTVIASLFFEYQGGTALDFDAGSTGTVVNNTLDGDRAGLVVAGGTVTFANNLVTNNSFAGLWEQAPSTLDLVNNDVYNPSAANGEYYQFTSDPTGANGNLEVDPHYFNEANQQLDLVPGSPAEDAGISNIATGVAAPTTDFLGNPRYQDPNITGRGDGSGVDIGAIWVEQTATSNVDLATTAVNGPATGLEGQQATVNWTVQSVGAGTAPGSWHDAVYLSASPVFTPDAILLGQVQHTGNLGPGLSYNATGTFTLPAVTPGNYYFLVRCNSENEVFEGANLANNVFASTPVAMSLPALTIGTVLNGSLAATGLSEAYQVTTTAGGNLNITLTGASGNANQMFVAFGYLPTQETFDADSIVPNSANQTVSLANVQAGTYYILVFGASVPSAENFTLSATTPGFSITSVSPAQGSNTGQITLTINGAQFDGNSQPLLVDSSNATIQPLQVYYTDPGEISATFDLTGHSTGAATVEVVNTGGSVQSLPQGFTIVAGQPGQLVTSLSTPSSVRAGRTFPVTINYSNVGGTDLPAPILHLQATSPGLLSFTSDLSNTSTGLDLIAINPNGPAGVLPAGTHGSITVYATSTGAGTPVFSLTEGLYPDVPIDWTDAAPLIRPEGLTDAFWNALAGQLQTDIGSTWDAYQRVVAQDATLLPAGDGLNYSLHDVLNLEYTRAMSLLYTSVTGQLFLGDTSHPLGNVVIQLFDPTTGTAYEATSLTDGSFIVPDVSATTYNLQFGGYVTTGAAQLVVGSSGVSNAQLVVAPGGTITGNVVETPGGVPARGLVVTAIGDDGTTYTASTNLDGSYQIGSLPAGVYDVETGGGTITQAVASQVNVASGGVSPNVDLAVQSAATISGTVTGPTGPLAGATVAALGADGTGSSAVTDSNGAYTINGLSGQSYTLSATAPELVASQIANLTLATGGSLTGENFALAAAGSVTGEISQSANRTAAPDVFLTLQGTAGTFSSQADGNGAFTVSNLPPGTYTLATNSPNFMTFTTTVTVAPGAATTANLTTAPLGTVTGTVTNTTTGSPLPNVVVQATDASGEVTSALTDANGNYQLVGLDAGTYQIVLGDDGTPGVAQTSVTLGPSASTAVANLSVAVAGTLSGTVLQADGATPVADAQVSLVAGGQRILSMPTDGQGKYVFVILASGTYELQASAPGMAFPSITDVAVSGGTEQLGLNFQAGGAQIDGSVQAASGGQPIAGATVSIEQTNPGQTPVPLEGILTAADGSFALANAVPGVYRITVSADTYATTTQTFAVTTGSPAQLVFTLNPEAILQGTIRDADTGLPLSDARVLLTSPGNPLAGENAPVNSSGAYELGSIPPGSYQLLVAAPGYTSALIGDVTLGATPTLLNVGLAASSTTISGIVTGAAGPLGGATVTVEDANGVVWATTLTASDGTYSITSLPPGSYSIAARAVGYQVSAPSTAMVTVGQSVGGINVVLSAAAVTDAQVPKSNPFDHLPEDWMLLVQEPIPSNDAITALSLQLNSVLAKCQHPSPTLALIAQNMLAAYNDAYNQWATIAPKAARVPDKITSIQTLAHQMRSLIALVQDLSDQPYKTQSGFPLSKLAAILNDGLDEALEVYGDLAAGNVDDANTHTGMPKLNAAHDAAAEVQTYLENLSNSYFGNDPGFWWDSVVDPPRLQEIQHLANGIDLAVLSGMSGLTVAANFLKDKAAYISAGAAAEAAVALLAGACGGCSSGGTQPQLVNVLAGAVTPMAGAEDPEPG